VLAMMMTIGAILLGNANVSLARTPEEALSDDQLLGRAVSDIGRMDRAELDLFTETVAQCWDRPGGVSSAPTCDRTFRVYRTQWKDGRAIDLVIFAWWMVASQLPKPGVDRKMDRWFDVGDAFQDAANVRYKTLRSSL
jgi:hypothetical protein